MTTDKDFQRFVELLDQADRLAEMNPESSAEITGPRIYLSDTDSGICFSIAYTSDAFVILEEEAARKQLDFQARVNDLETILAELISGKRAMNETARGALIVCSGLYLVGTLTYATYKNRGTHQQYVVLRYPDAQAGDHLLRPSIATTEKPLTATDIGAIVQSVLHADRTVHPERFGSITPICPRQKP